jgi:hypothetical protein
MPKIDYIPMGDYFLPAITLRDSPDKSDYNRHVKSLNAEIKQTKARIRELKNDLYKHPIHNPPSIVEIMGNVGRRKTLKTDWQRVRNLQTQAMILMFLQQNNIASVEDFADIVVRTNEWLETVTDAIKKAERRLETLTIHFTHNDNTNTHRALVQKYRKLKPKKDETALNSLNLFTRNKATKDYEASTAKYEAFYKKHADTIDAYEAAQAHFAIVMNGKKLAYQGLANRAKRTRRQAV